MTSAILLDTFLGTLGRDEMIAELGFFLYVIAGALVAGTTLWMWAVLRDFVSKPGISESTSGLSDDEQPREADDLVDGREHDQEEVFQELLSEASHEDLMDLIFDLGWSLNDLKPNLDKGEDIVTVIVSRALDRNQMENLRVAIGHLREPLPAENLPRTMRLKPNTPPMILRHYILQHLTLDQIDQMARELPVDFSDHQDHLKRMRTRQLLWMLIEQQRLASLIDMIQNIDPSVSGESR